MGSRTMATRVAVTGKYGRQDIFIENDMIAEDVEQAIGGMRNDPLWIYTAAKVIEVVVRVGRQQDIEVSSQGEAEHDVLDSGACCFVDFDKDHVMSLRIVRREDCDIGGLDFGRGSLAVLSGQRGDS